MKISTIEIGKIHLNEIKIKDIIIVGIVMI